MRALGNYKDMCLNSLMTLRHLVSMKNGLTRSTQCIRLIRSVCVSVADRFINYLIYLERILRGCLGLHYSKCDSWTNSIKIDYLGAWQNCKSQAPFQTHRIRICILTGKHVILIHMQVWDQLSEFIICSHIIQRYHI